MANGEWLMVNGLPVQKPESPTHPARITFMQRQTLKTMLTWAAIAAALLGVFAMYIRPEFLVTLADQLWACF